MICEFQKQYEIDYAAKSTAKRRLTRGKLSTKRMSGLHLTTQLTTFRRQETTACGGDDAEEDSEIEDEDDSEDGEGRTAFGRAAKTETGAQVLLQNRSSEEDTFEEGTSGVCLRWACRVQQDHRHAQRRHSGCATSLLEVSHSPQRHS